MKNTLGNNVKITLFGESHGPYVGAVLDGMIPGIKINYEFINQQLAKRRPRGIHETSRIELDKYQIISGVFNDYTTGAPLCVIIPNENITIDDTPLHKPSKPSIKLTLLTTAIKKIITIGIIQKPTLIVLVVKGIYISLPTILDIYTKIAINADIPNCPIIFW